MDLYELIRKNRSYRRFYEDYSIDFQTIKMLIDLARLSPSARNAQPIKYYVALDKATNEKIFETLAWAGYLNDWNGPEPGERPAAYIIMLGDTDITDNYFCDHGIAAQSIL